MLVLRLTRYLISVSVMIFGSCHLILFVSSTNYFRTVKQQRCLIGAVFIKFILIMFIIMTRTNYQHQRTWGISIIIMTKKLSVSRTWGIFIIIMVIIIMTKKTWTLPRAGVPLPGWPATDEQPVGKTSWSGLIINFIRIILWSSE